MPLEDLGSDFTFEVLICDGARALSSPMALFTISSSADLFFSVMQDQNFGSFGIATPGNFSAGLSFSLCD
jgi:hypothetical protein